MMSSPPRPIPIPMARSMAQSRWHHSDESDSESISPKVMRFADIPKDSACLYRIQRDFYIAFADIAAKPEDTCLLRTPDGEPFTHFLHLRHPPTTSSDDDKVALASNQAVNTTHSHTLSLTIPSNPVADAVPDPPKYKITDEKLASMHKFLEPARLGITMEKLKALLMPEEDMTEHQNVLNLTAAQLRTIRQFAKSSGYCNKASNVRDDDDDDDDDESATEQVRMLVTTPRNRRTDGMSAAVACLAATGTEKARQIISRLDGSEEMKETAWHAVVESSIAGRLDGDTLF